VIELNHLPREIRVTGD